MLPVGSSLRLALLAALLPMTGLAACGTEASLGEQASASYDGPLHLPKGDGRHPGAGAAGDVVDCDAWGSGSVFHGDVYSEGATADTPARAVETAASEGMGFFVPEDLAVAATTDDRVLFVAEVAGRAKAAVIVHDGEAAEGTGGDGWYVESWAVCDVVELPADLVEGLGIEVWTDADGRIVPTRRLEVRHGPEHCEMQGMTFLSLGSDERAPEFVRDPDSYFRRTYVAEPFEPHASLPADAVDSGFRRDGERLWLAADRSRAYVGAAPDDVELWPRVVEQWSCD